MKFMSSVKEEMQAKMHRETSTDSSLLYNSSIETKIYIARKLQNKLYFCKSFTQKG